VERLVGDVEVGLKGAFETAKGRAGESANNGFVVNKRTYGVSGDVVMAEPKPTDKSSVDVEAR
jgi:hypothetical protein